MPRLLWNLDKVRKYCEENNIVYLDDYYNGSEKLNFQCYCGEKFTRRFSNVILGQTICNNCRKEKMLEARQIESKKNYFKFKEFVENSNTGCELLASVNEYKDNKTKLNMRCSCGNVFQPTPNNFMRGKSKRCSICRDKDNGWKRRLDKDYIFSFVESQNYTPLSYKYDVGHWITVKCDNKNHPEYDVIWNNFLAGNRCPICNKSKGERKLEEVLIKFKIEYKTQYSFDDLLGENNSGLRYDFAVFYDNKLTLIEYDGIQHFEPKFGEEEFQRTIKNDKLKNDYCKNNNIRLIRIPYYQFDIIEYIITNHFNIR